MPQPKLALDHIAARTRVAHEGTARVLRLWRSFNPERLDVSWDFYWRDMVRVVSAAQVTAANQATPYVNAIATATDPPAAIVPAAFGGVMLDGRELAPAMYSAVTHTKQLTPSLGSTRAFEVGASYLATIVGAAIQDLGRQADLTLAGGRGYIRYIRVLSPGACARCAVLAGKGSAREPFLRHPRCKCQAWPVQNGSRAGLFESADDYFDSLSKSEQDRLFTSAGAEAIRNGADINKVVNARRGAYGIGYSNTYSRPIGAGRLQPITIGVKADGTPLQVYATTEGTTRRGDFGRQNFAGGGRRTTTVRLMPEQMFVMAGDDPERWAKLLRRYGYLV